MKSPTLHDVAKVAGVSYATADRVVNRRGNVAQKSVRKVSDAVAQLGYVRNIAAAKLSQSKSHKFAFVLPHRSHAFFGRMHGQLEKATAHLKSAQVEIDVIEVDAFDAKQLGEAMSGLKVGHYDGIAFVGVGHMTNPAALAKLREGGSKIVSLVSDVFSAFRDYYIGIDNVVAGRTAARLAGLSHGGNFGNVVIAAGSRDARDHADRISGFTEVLTRNFPNINVAAVIETKDQARALQDQLANCFEQSAPISAIYNVGAGNEGLIKAVRRCAQDRPPFCIVHELSDITRDALEKGIIDVAIDQRPEIEMSRALALLQSVADGLPPPPSPELIPMIFLRDNLPNS